MNNIDELAKVRITTKHFSQILLIEFGYCFGLFFCFRFFPFLNEKTTDIGKALIEIYTYLALIFLVPFIFNVLQIIKVKRLGDYGKLNNYILVEILSFILAYKFLI